MFFRGLCLILFVRVVSLTDKVIRFCPGSDIVLHCHYNSTEKLLSVVWFVENEDVSSYTAETNRLVDNNETKFQIQNGSFSLKVFGITESQKYKCRVVDAMNDVERNFWTTQPQPDDSLECSSYTAIVGSFNSGNFLKYHILTEICSLVCLL
ncbi:uncharacterized protein [Antedon mediterranea]|uniref:uncharacterized protein isoform X2 n=1 Tax=Antedon mediterranea TaxID=105859 RepID=UPI003AF76354